MEFVYCCNAVDYEGYGKPSDATVMYVLMILASVSTE